MDQSKQNIKDISTSTFEVDVIQASNSSPVIVDFWAPWCGPCKQLTPLLEKLTNEYNGEVDLCKINIDENQAGCWPNGYPVNSCSIYIQRW
jgi:putative thioredoxin